MRTRTPDRSCAAESWRTWLALVKTVRETSGEQAQLASAAAASSANRPETLGWAFLLATVRHTHNTQQLIGTMLSDLLPGQFGRTVGRPIMAAAASQAAPRELRPRRPINNRPAGCQPAPQQMAKVRAGWFRLKKVYNSASESRLKYVSFLYFPVASV